MKELEIRGLRERKKNMAEHNRPEVKSTLDIIFTKHKNNIKDMEYCHPREKEEST